MPVVGRAGISSAVIVDGRVFVIDCGRGSPSAFADERAGVGELILTHYLPAEPHAISDAEWAERAGHGYRGTTTAGTDGLRRALPRSTGTLA